MGLLARGSVGYGLGNMRMKLAAIALLFGSFLTAQQPLLIDGTFGSISVVTVEFSQQISGLVPQDPNVPPFYAVILHSSNPKVKFFRVVIDYVQERQLFIESAGVAAVDPSADIPFYNVLSDQVRRIQIEARDADGTTVESYSFRIGGVR